MVHRLLKIFDTGSSVFFHLIWKISPKYLMICETFTWSKLYGFLPKLNNFEKELVIMFSRNLNFTKQVSWMLLKVTIICVETPFLSFLVLIYHHAVLAFSPCLNKELMYLAWMLSMLCCFIVTDRLPCLAFIPDHSVNS